MEQAHEVGLKVNVLNSIYTTIRTPYHLKEVNVVGVEPRQALIHALLYLRRCHPHALAAVAQKPVAAVRTC